MRGIYLINIPSNNRIAARKISSLVDPFKAKYPMKNDTALPAVNMDAPVRNIRNRSAPAGWSLFKGKNTSTGLSRSRPDLLKVKESIVTGRIINTTTNLGKYFIPRMSGIVSVAIPKMKGNSTDIKKFLARRF
jgi:hypothetical protein